MCWMFSHRLLLGSSTNPEWSKSMVCHVYQQSLTLSSSCLIVPVVSVTFPGLNANQTLLSSSVSLIVWCPCCENYPHTHLFPMLETFNFNCLSFFFSLQSSPCFRSSFSAYPSLSFRLSLFHSFVDEHLYC